MARRGSTGRITPTAPRRHLSCHSRRRVLYCRSSAVLLLNMPLQYRRRVMIMDILSQLSPAAHIAIRGRQTIQIPDVSYHTILFFYFHQK